MKKKGWLNIVSALGAVFVLAILIVKSLPINREKHEEYQNSLEKQKNIDAILNQDILKSNSEMRTSYELLIKHLSQLENIQKKLNIIPKFIDKKGKKELRTLLRENSEMLKQKESLLEQFKSQNTMLKNSLQYLLVLNTELVNNNSAGSWNQNLVILLDELFDNILFYNLTSDEEIATLIEIKIDKLKQFKEEENKFLIDLVVNHARIILRNKPQINAVTQQLLELPTKQGSEELEQVYSKYHQQAIDRVHTYRLYVYGWSSMVLGWIAYLVIKDLMKINRRTIHILENFTTELESRVEERTAQLAESMKVAENARTKAEDANVAKSRFLANMSHEVRTPLNAILGFTQLMKRDLSLDREYRENLEIINRSGEHLLELIDDILEMSKIEAGRAMLNEHSFDLYSLLNNIEDMLRLKAKSKGLQFIFDFAPNLPQYIKTDEAKLRQVLINLLGNGIKFTKEGGVTLRAGLRTKEDQKNFISCLPQPLTSQTFFTPPELKEEREDDGEENPYYLYFEVEDTGEGIAPEEMNQLFAPFGQTETGRKSQEGTGLGLPITKKFVELMGGKLSLRSTPGKGTIFSFDIQIKLAEASEIETNQKMQVIGLEADQPEYRILAVDDRPESRLLLVKLLSSLGFQVREAANGQEAVALWESWSPQLILMDMQMPVMDGYEATKRIKKHLKGQATVIIALTASAFEEERTFILSSGCDDFVRKPFQERVLLEKMAEHLGVRYIYEQEDSQLRDFQTSQASVLDLSPEAVAVMSTEWLAQLQAAAEQVDNQHIFQLIEQIPSEHTTLATTLKHLVDNFRCDKIIDLTEQAIK